MITYRDTWPSLDHLWVTRHQPFRHPWMGEQRGLRVCVTCSHIYAPGEYRAHLRSIGHRMNRGWWR